MRTRPFGLLLSLLVMTAMISLPGCVLTQPLKIASGKAELEDAFPGFEIERFDYFREDAGLFPIDEASREGATFLLRYRADPRLRISGTLDYIPSEGSWDDGVQDTVFNGERLNASQLGSFVRTWTAYSDVPLTIDDDRFDLSQSGNLMLRTAVTQMAAGDQAYDDAVGEKWAAAHGITVDDVFAFPREDGSVYWLYLDRKSGKWTHLGDAREFLAALGYPPPP